MQYIKYTTCTTQTRKSQERSKGQKASTLIMVFAEENEREEEECFSMSSRQRSFAASVPHRSSIDNEISCSTTHPS